MKKLFLFAALAVFGFTNVNAQEGGFKAGLTVGLPVGDADEVYSLALNAEFSYLFAVADSFEVGPTAGYLHYLVKSDYSDFVDGASFLPIGATARFYASEDLFFGADLGYGVGISPDGNDGGFYYKPKVGYNLGAVALVLSYSGVSVDGGTFNALGLGAEFSF